MRRASLDNLFAALSVPGIDPRTFIADGRVSDDDEAVEIIDGCVYADVEVAGIDSSEDEAPIITAKWMFMTDGSGGVIYTGLPKKGSPCILFVVNGNPESGVYAFSTQSMDYKLPSSVIADPNSFHIVAPSGGQVKIGSRGTSGMKKAARVDDEVLINSDTASGFMSFLNKLVIAWNTSISSASPMIATGLPVPVTADPSVAFEQIHGKVSKGSSRVLIGGESV